jgi:hypothetical protein
MSRALNAFMIIDHICSILTDYGKMIWRAIAESIIITALLLPFTPGINFLTIFLTIFHTRYLYYKMTA